MSTWMAGGFIALVLLATATAAVFFVLTRGALMLRSLSRLLNTDAGIDATNLLTARISLPDSYSPEQVQLFWQRLLERAHGLAGVTNAAIIDCPPLAGGCNGTVAWNAM